MKKLLSLLLSTVILLLCAEENNGKLYKVPSAALKGMRGLAKRIAIPNTEFQYTPAPSKTGVLSDLAMSAYAVSHDSTILALAESVKQADGSYFSRVVFMEYARFKIVNAVEFNTQGKIKEIFFFYDKLFLVTEGEKTQIQAILLNSKLQLFKKTLNLPSEFSSVCTGKIFFYVKCADKKLLQIDDALQINSTIETRFNGGHIFIRQNSDTVTNFTKENIEYIKKNNSGMFKSNYHDLQNIAEPEKVFLQPRNTRDFYFSAKNGRLYKMVNSTHCEEIEVSPFQDIFLHPFKNEFYLLAKKKQLIEIVRLTDYRVRRRLSHNTMKPETYKFLKFIIPHRNGIFLVTQEGEFAQIVERKRRFYKYKL